MAERWIYHDTEQAQIIDESDLDEYLKAGWRISFRKPGEGEEALELPKDTPVSLDPVNDLEALKERARGLGIEVDGRWGQKRLMQAIDEWQSQQPN